VRSRWIGWSVVVCALATTQDADSAHRPRHAKARPKVVARAEPAPRPKAAPPRPAAPPAPGNPAADQELARLADDPLLGRADAIDGKGVTGFVAFTFDDGPNPDTTPAVLEALQKYNVPATFFIVTRRISGPLGEKNREVLAKEIAGGFTIASHSVSHTNLRNVSPKAMGHEIDQSLRTLSKATGHSIGLFRPPYGALDDRGRDHLKKRGLTEVRWSIDPADWRIKETDKLRARTLATIVRQGGGVVLMHDVKEVTAGSLAFVLDDLEGENCRRLAARQEPILPVSIHYWLRDNGKPRSIPEAVKQRTLAYRKALPARCAARPKPESPKAEPPPAPRLASTHAKRGKR
jgi:peptidoglycan/xylan/chitin deacetylase (PgdA/CDA1 family)